MLRKSAHKSKIQTDEISLVGILTGLLFGHVLKWFTEQAETITNTDNFFGSILRILPLGSFSFLLF